MHLTPEEERLYAGEQGPGRQRAMELLVALGEIYGAQRLIPISSAQVSGASFKTIGDAGIRFLEDFCCEPGLKVSVRASLNPLGLDLRRWKSMGVSDQFHSRQARIVQAYASLGIEPLYSCTPYLAGNRPRRGQHLAWAESSATVFANSYLGAFTNREGGPSALAAAIVGRTPEYGLHLEENRKAKVVFALEALPEELAPIAGHVVGRLAGKRIPHLTGLRLSEDGHKAFGAALAATSAVSMYTYAPEGDGRSAGQSDAEERISLSVSDLERAAEDLAGGSQWDLVAIGCPHCSSRELHAMAKALRGRKPSRDCDVWFCTSRSVYGRCPKEVAVLRRFGKVLCDTCMVVAPIEEKYRSTASDSGKAMVYLPTLGRQQASFRTRKSLLEAISR